MQITNNIRTHIVYIKTMDWKSVDEIHITKQQYNIIKEDIVNLKANDFYSITDIDTWMILFEWQRKDILRFREKNIKTNSWYQAICDYWNYHDLINWGIICECFNKYKFLSSDLRVWASKEKGIIYPKDITEDMKREFYIKLKKEWKL